MKKKVLLSSICTIALCLCLIAGSTFALFTSQSDVNISVTAGDVDVVASIAIDKLESVKGDENGTIVDENGATYSYETVDPTFTNGGTASVAEGVLTLDKVTPGDKVTFTVTGTNNSNVASQIRYVITCEDGYTLMSGLVIYTPDGAYESVDTYTSAWDEVGVGSDFVKTFAIELPVDRGNLYEKQTTEIRILVEAVQGNAVVDNDGKPDVEYIEKAATTKDAIDALKNPNTTYVLFIDDVTATITEPVANKLIDANGKDIQLTFTNTIENVTVSNVVETEGGNSINLKDATGDITITDSKFISGSGTGAVAILTGPAANITVENCDFSATEGGKTYAIYYSGSSGSITIEDSVFTGFSSWAIQINNPVNGDVVIDGCTFNTPDGVFKCVNGGGITGNFTFTNNTMIGVQGHDGKADQILSVKFAGTATVTGNTLNGDTTWTPAVTDTDPNN